MGFNMSSIRSGRIIPYYAGQRTPLHARARTNVMPPLRIVHVITELATGGAERTLYRLISGTNGEAIENSVVSLTDEGEIGPLLRASRVPVQCLGMRRGVPAPRALFRLHAILERDRPAILQTWLYHADLMGLMTARFAPVGRLIWNIRCSDMDMRHYSFISRATRRVLALMSRIPDAVIVNSHAGLATHRRLGYSPRRWELIPNGIDLELFVRDKEGARALRDELAIPVSAPVIGTVGRFDPMKDYGTFLAAAAMVRMEKPSLRILMAGKGMQTDNDALTRLISNAGLSGIAMLVGERKDIPRVLSALDVYCLSSAFGEGFPNALAEAMACEVPVVTTNVGDASWITGIAGVPAGDYASFAARVADLLNLSPAAREAYGAAQRGRIQEEFGLPRMIAAYESLYGDLVGH